jgi:hypothetical protein
VEDVVAALRFGRDRRLDVAISGQNVRPAP